MKQRSSGGIWPIPVALAFLTCVGLVSGLVADDLWDVVSWVGLGVPLLVLVWCIWVSPRPGKNPRR